MTDPFVPKEPGTYAYTLFGETNQVEVYRDNHGLWVRSAGLPVSPTQAAQSGTFHPVPILPPEEGK